MLRAHQENHSEVVENLLASFDNIIEDPDYILKDSKKEDTVRFIKKCSETNINVITKLSVKKNADSKYLNSVITSYKINDKQLNQYLNNNKHLH